MNRVDTDVKIGVSNGICATIVNKSAVIDTCFERVDSELKRMTNETIETYSGDIADKVSRRLDRTMAAIPCGLPVLPPHWIFTINVWTYEIIGRYEEFALIDNDNEVIPKPYFGHKGQKYVRNEDRVRHPYMVDEMGNPIWLGKNTRIVFSLNGYCGTIVGSGPRGVGDKTGGKNEKSVAYDTLVLETGGLI